MSTTINNNKFYYDQTNFLNIGYALGIAVETHLANLLFGGDLTRMVYASNEFAFRARTKNSDSDYNNLNLPFVNYKIDKIISGTSERQLFNHITNIEGMFVEEIGEKFKIVPITVNFQATLFIHQDADLIKASSIMFQDDSNETVLYPELIYGDFCLPIPAFLGAGDYGYSYDAEYNENDYLESNKIKTLGMDFNLETMFIYANDDVSVSEETLLEFVTVKGLLDEDSPKDSESVQSVIEVYFSED